MDETHRIAEGIGTSPTTSHRIARSRLEFEGGRPAGRRLVLRGVPMATNRITGWPSRFEGQTGSGASAEAARPRMPATSEASHGRGLGIRLSERPLDTETNQCGHPQGVRCCVPPQSCLAAAATCGLVVSSARATSDPTEPRGHCSMEALQVAAYKKRSNKLGPIWFSSMKAAFLSFRPADGRGDRKGRHPLFTTTTDTTASPLWPPSVCRLSASTWVCICGSNRTTFMRPMWPRFSVHSYDTCGVRSYCCGTMAPSTKDPSLPNCRRTIPDFTLKPFPAMRPNSIQSSRSGMTSRAIPPTVCFETSSISGSDSTTMHGVCVALEPNSDHSSWRPTSPRHRGSHCITYAKRYSSGRFATLRAKRCK
jgi:hypothetical protein